MLVPRITVVPSDPAPVNFVARRADQFIKPLPEINIFYRLLGRCFPASGLPAIDPFRHAFQHILAVHMKRDMAGALQGGQRLDHGQHFHAVIGRVEFTTKKLLLGV